jgi:hypothetical protein
LGNQIHALAPRVFDTIGHIFHTGVTVADEIVTHPSDALTGGATALVDGAARVVNAALHLCPRRATASPAPSAGNNGDVATPTDAGGTGATIPGVTVPAAAPVAEVTATNTVGNNGVGPADAGGAAPTASATPMPTPSAYNATGGYILTLPNLNQLHMGLIGEEGGEGSAF